MSNEPSCQVCSTVNLIYALTLGKLSEDSKLFKKFGEEVMQIKLHPTGMVLYAFISEETGIDVEKLGTKLHKKGEDNVLQLKVTGNVPDCQIRKSLAANMILHEQALTLYGATDNSVLEQAYFYKKISDRYSNKAREQKSENLTSFLEEVLESMSQDQHSNDN